MWEKRSPSNSLIELFPCSYKSESNVRPIIKYMTATIQKINSPPEAVRIVVETPLQTTNVSFNRRLSQYLHRSPILSNGCVSVADYSYTVVSYDVFKNNSVFVVHLSIDPFLHLP